MKTLEELQSEVNRVVFLEKESTIAKLREYNALLECNIKPELMWEILAFNGSYDTTKNAAFFSEYLQKCIKGYTKQVDNLTELLDTPPPTTAHCIAVLFILNDGWVSTVYSE